MAADVEYGPVVNLKHSLPAGADALYFLREHALVSALKEFKSILYPDLFQVPLISGGIFVILRKIDTVQYIIPLHIIKVNDLILGHFQHIDHGIRNRL